MCLDEKPAGIHENVSSSVAVVTAPAEDRLGLKNRTRHPKASDLNLDCCFVLIIICYYVPFAKLNLMMN